MKAVVQRVEYASIEINGGEPKEIKQGLVVLIGIANEDTLEDILWLSKKICNLRVFDDSDGIMNLSINDIVGELMLVSQFTLYASTKKGNRPSYIKAAKPDIAIPLYEKSICEFTKLLKTDIVTGEFGANMKINLTNDGPVTIIIDTKNKA